MLLAVSSNPIRKFHRKGALACHASLIKTKWVYFKTIKPDPSSEAVTMLRSVLFHLFGFLTRLVTEHNFLPPHNIASRISRLAAADEKTFKKDVTRKD
jgi:hypothetical protein